MSQDTLLYNTFQVVAEIAAKTKSLQENEKWIVLMFDEMKIQENLVSSLGNFLF